MSVAAEAQAPAPRPCYFGSCPDIGSGGLERPAGCIVADPTGTPLNVRAAPQGAIIGTLANGVQVRITRSGKDARGQPWVYIEHGPSQQALGWVFRRFLRCEVG